MFDFRAGRAQPRPAVLAAAWAAAGRALRPVVDEWGRVRFSPPSLLMTMTSRSMVSLMVSMSPLMSESTVTSKISESRIRLWTSGR